MASLRFLFSSARLPNLRHHSPYSLCKAFVAAASSGSSLASGVAVSQKPINPILQNAFFFNDHRSFHFWASTLRAASSKPEIGDPFPLHLNDSRQLLGIGSWKKECVYQDICVCTFGVYADDGDLEKVLEATYASFSTVNRFFSNKGKHIRKNLLGADICMTVRLQVVYSKTSSRVVRELFNESVGGRLRKLRGSAYEELLPGFTSQFKDEQKIGLGSVIDLSRERGHVLHTTIAGEKVGTIQDQFLCQSIFDLYIGEDPVDTKAKKDIELKLASLRPN